jgi:hypothetical protein
MPEAGTFPEYRSRYRLSGLTFFHRCFGLASNHKILAARGHHCLFQKCYIFIIYFDIVFDSV